jgi:hypothetical protein
MAKSVVNPVYEQSANQAYAKGGFRPRRFRERRPRYVEDIDPSLDQPMLFSQDSLPEDWAAEYLDLFLGYGHYGDEVQYEAWKLTTPFGVFAYYKIHRPGVNYVLCQHTSYVVA